MDNLIKFELSKFKADMGLTTIKFHKMQTKKGLRYKAFASDVDGNELQLITTVDFDSTVQCWVYFDPATVLYTLSNNRGVEEAVAFEL